MTIDGSLLIALLALVTDGVLGFIERKMANRTSHKKQKRKVFVAAAAIVLSFRYIIHQA